MGKGVRKGSESIGKILRIDLSKPEWFTEEVDFKVIETFMGGVGLATKILYEETGPKTDPLGRENVVIISAGLLNGTNAPTAYRGEITTKSPLTGIYASGNHGGVFGSKLRMAGFETMVVRGKSARPVSLVLDDGKVELRDASHLWGKDAWEVTEALRLELGEDFSVMAIGQGGENLVKFACPVVDYFHAPGRSHAGCVMGSKNLKAVAVRGTQKKSIASLEMFKETAREIEDRIRSYPERGLRQEVGSICKVVDSAKKGRLQARNFQVGSVPQSNDLWRPEGFKQHLRKGPTYCGNCLLSTYYGCSATADITEGRHKGLKMRGGAFSLLLWQWASQCGIESLLDMLKCKELCNRYGIDQVGPIPFAIELFQRGIITKEDLDDNELNWGDVDAIVDLLSRITHRKGFGNILAEGASKAAELIGKGAEQYAMTIKGMEMMACPDPRSGGMAKNLGNICSLRGGDDVKTTHTIFEGLPDWARNQGMDGETYLKWFLGLLDMFDEVKNEIYGVPPSLDSSTYTPERIALMTKWYEDLSLLRDSLGVCLFATHTTSAIGPTYCSRLASSYLGSDFSPEEMMEVGERITNVAKAYNIREGVTRSDDDFPSRFYLEPLKDGSDRGPTLSRGYMNDLLEAYYEIRGWNRKTGNPTREKLQELGLESVAKDMEKLGTLG